jgi:hypothetical protein
MEKKGEILNQLAIISDLLEKVNMEDPIDASVIFELEENEFNKMFDKITKKIPHYQSNGVGNSFSVKIGIIDFVFNKSNV